MQICSKFVQLHDSKCPVERELQLQNFLKTWKTLILKCFEFNAYFAKVGGGVVKNGTRLKIHIEQCLPCPMLLKQKFVDQSCKIMNESDSEESVENWLVHFSCKILKKRSSLL